MIFLFIELDQTLKDDQDTYKINDSLELSYDEATDGGGDDCAVVGPAPVDTK